MVEFGNPIVGQEDLIRSAIKSPDFSADPESGVTGWRIARDGSATFYNLTVGNSNFTIDQNGNAVFNDVSAASIHLNGEDLQSVLDARAKGVISVTTVTGTSALYTGTALVVGRIVIPNFDGTRQYAIGCSCLSMNNLSTSTQDVGRVNIDCYIAWDTPASNTDTLLFGSQWPLPEPPESTAYDINLHFRHPFQDLTPDGTDAHFAFYFRVDQTTGNAQIQTGGSGRYYTEDIGPAVLYTSFDLGGGGGQPAQQYVKTYSATASASFQSNGTNRGISECYQGQYSSTNGNQYSMIGFNDTQIRADTAGSTINKVELYLNNNHFYNNSGGIAVIGTHNQTSLSGSHSSSQVNDNLDQESFTYGQAKWFTLPNSIGTALRDNTAKGIALGPGPSTSKTYYGYFAGNGQSGEPQLRITYTK